MKIWIRYPKENRNSIEDLNKVKIKTLSGSLIPLEEVANYDYKRGRVKINHINGTKEIRVDASLYNAEFSSEVNNQIEKEYLSILKTKFPNSSVSVCITMFPFSSTRYTIIFLES